MSPIEVEKGRFTVGVFQDAAWAQKGVEALKKAGFPPEAFSVLAKDSAELPAFIERVCGAGAERLDVSGTGPVLAGGPLVDALQGDPRDLPKQGLAATMRRV